MPDVPKEVNVTLARQKYRRIKGTTGDLQMVANDDENRGTGESLLN